MVDKKKDEHEETMDEILSSIRQLVYPQEGIIDLTRPIEDHPSEKPVPSSDKPDDKQTTDRPEDLQGMEEAIQAFAAFRRSVSPLPASPVTQEGSLEKMTVEELIYKALYPLLENHLESWLQTTPTIEPMIRQLLPVLLKSWIDKHLPAIVTQCVREKLDEIQHHSQP